MWMTCSTVWRSSTSDQPSTLPKPTGEEAEPHPSRAKHAEKEEVACSWKHDGNKSNRQRSFERYQFFVVARSSVLPNLVLPFGVAW